MLISVVMPVKNAEKTILRATKSILQQSISDWELIIIDDSSTDKSISLVSALEDPRIKIFTNKGQGIASALNSGIRHAGGSYIARMDADDTSHPTRLEKQLKYSLKNEEIDVISCLVEYKSESSESQAGYSYHVDWLNSILTPDEHFYNRFADAPVAHPTVFFKAEVIKKFGNYTCSSLPEDFDLWLRWMEQGVKFIKVPEILFTWYDRQSRLSRTSRNYSPDKFFSIKADYFNSWWQKNNNNRELWIWGFGKDVFRKSNYLIKKGLTVKGYYDIKERTNSSRNVQLYSKITAKNNQFILVYIGDRKGKSSISAFFETYNRKPGEDYYFMA